MPASVPSPSHVARAARTAGGLGATRSCWCDAWMCRFAFSPVTEPSAATGGDAPLRPSTSTSMQPQSNSDSLQPKSSVTVTGTGSPAGGSAGGNTGKATNLTLARVTTSSGGGVGVSGSVGRTETIESFYYGEARFCLFDNVAILACEQEGLRDASLASAVQPFLRRSHHRHHRSRRQAAAAVAGASSSASSVNYAAASAAKFSLEEIAAMHTFVQEWLARFASSQTAFMSAPPDSPARWTKNADDPTASTCEFLLFPLPCVSFVSWTNGLLLASPPHLSSIVLSFSMGGELRLLFEPCNPHHAMAAFRAVRFLSDPYTSSFALENSVADYCDALALKQAQEEDELRRTLQRPDASPVGSNNASPLAPPTRRAAWGRGGEASARSYDSISGTSDNSLPPDVRENRGRNAILFGPYRDAAERAAIDRYAAAAEFMEHFLFTILRHTVRQPPPPPERTLRGGQPAESTRLSVPPNPRYHDIEAIVRVGENNVGTRHRVGGGSTNLIENGPEPSAFRPIITDAAVYVPRALLITAAAMVGEPVPPRANPASPSSRLHKRISLSDVVMLHVLKAEELLQLSDGRGDNVACRPLLEQGDAELRDGGILLVTETEGGGGSWWLLSLSRESQRAVTRIWLSRLARTLGVTDLVRHSLDPSGGGSRSTGGDDGDGSSSSAPQRQDGAFTEVGVDTLDRLLHRFQCIDRSRDGSIDQDELDGALGALFECSEFVERLFSTLDADGSGLISFQEFAQGLVGMIYSSARAKLAETLRMFDGDRDGKITRSELRSVFMSLLSTGDIEAATGTIESVTSAIMREVATRSSLTTMTAGGGQSHHRHYSVVPSSRRVDPSLPVGATLTEAPQQQRKSAHRTPHSVEIATLLLCTYDNAAVRAQLLALGLDVSSSNSPQRLRTLTRNEDGIMYGSLDWFLLGSLMQCLQVGMQMAEVAAAPPTAGEGGTGGGGELQVLSKQPVVYEMMSQWTASAGRAAVNVTPALMKRVGHDVPQILQTLIDRVDEDIAAAASPSSATSFASSFASSSAASSDRGALLYRFAIRGTDAIAAACGFSEDSLRASLAIDNLVAHFVLGTAAVMRPLHDPDPSRPDLLSNDTSTHGYDPHAAAFAYVTGDGNLLLRALPPAQFADLIVRIAPQVGQHVLNHKGSLLPRFLFFYAIVGFGRTVCFTVQANYARCDSPLTHCLLLRARPVGEGKHSEKDRAQWRLSIPNATLRPAQAAAAPKVLTERSLLQPIVLPEEWALSVEREGKRDTALLAQLGISEYRFAIAFSSPPSALTQVAISEKGPAPPSLTERLTARFFKRPTGETAPDAMPDGLPTPHQLFEFHQAASDVVCFVRALALQSASLLQLGRGSAPSNAVVSTGGGAASGGSMSIPSPSPGGSSMASAGHRGGSGGGAESDSLRQESRGMSPTFGDVPWWSARSVDMGYLHQHRGGIPCTDDGSQVAVVAILDILGANTSFSAITASNNSASPTSEGSKAPTQDDNGDDGDHGDEDGAAADGSVSAVADVPHAVVAGGDQQGVMSNAGQARPRRIAVARSFQRLLMDYVRLMLLSMEGDGYRRSALGTGASKSIFALYDEGKRDTLLGRHRRCFEATRDSGGECFVVVEELNRRVLVVSDLDPAAEPVEEFELSSGAFTAVRPSHRPRPEKHAILGDGKRDPSAASSAGTQPRQHPLGTTATSMTTVCRAFPIRPHCRVMMRDVLRLDAKQARHLEFEKVRVITVRSAAAVTELLWAIRQLQFGLPWALRGELSRKIRDAMLRIDSSDDTAASPDNAAWFRNPVALAFSGYGYKGGPLGKKPPMDAVDAWRIARPLPLPMIEFSAYCPRDTTSVPVCVIHINTANAFPAGDLYPLFLPAFDPSPSDLVVVSLVALSVVTFPRWRRAIEDELPGMHLLRHASAPGAGILLFASSAIANQLSGIETGTVTSTEGFAAAAVSFRVHSSATLAIAADYPYFQSHHAAAAVTTGQETDEAGGALLNHPLSKTRVKESWRLVSPDPSPYRVMPQHPEAWWAHEIHCRILEGLATKMGDARRRDLVEQHNVVLWCMSCVVSPMPMPATVLDEHPSLALSCTLEPDLHIIRSAAAAIAAASQGTLNEEPSGSNASRTPPPPSAGAQSFSSSSSVQQPSEESIVFAEGNVALMLCSTAAGRASLQQLDSFSAEMESGSVFFGFKEHSDRRFPPTYPRALSNSIATTGTATSGDPLGMVAAPLNTNSNRMRREIYDLSVFPLPVYADRILVRSSGHPLDNCSIQGYHADDTTLRSVGFHTPQALRLVLPARLPNSLPPPGLPVLRAAWAGVLAVSLTGVRWATDDESQSHEPTAAAVTSNPRAVTAAAAAACRPRVRLFLEDVFDFELTTSNQSTSRDAAITFSAQTRDGGGSDRAVDEPNLVVAGSADAVDAAYVTPTWPRRRRGWSAPLPRLSFRLPCCNGPCCPSK